MPGSRRSTRTRPSRSMMSQRASSTSSFDGIRTSFADTEVSGAGEVESNWDAIKAAEKSRQSAMEGIPLGLPALSLAHKVVARAARARSESWSTRGQPTGGQATPAELADLLVAVVVAAHEVGADPEQLLRQRARDIMAQVESRNSVPWAMTAAPELATLSMPVRR